jgi:hypothetical protein
MPLFLKQTQKVHTRSIILNSTAMVSLKKPYTPAGFERWSAVHEADEMSPASRQGIMGLLLMHIKLSSGRSGGKYVLHTYKLL